MKILFLTYRLPCPPVTGDRVRVLQHIKLLSSEHDIYVLSLYQDDDELQYLSNLEEFCKAVYTVKINIITFYCGAFKSLFSRMPLQCGFYGASASYKRKLKKIIKDENIDIVYTSLVSMAPYVANNLNLPSVLDYCDALSLQFLRRFKRENIFSLRKLLLLFEANRLRKYERQLLSKFRPTLITSQEDADYISKNNQPSVVPNYYEVKNIFKTLFDTEEQESLAITGDMAGYDNIKSVEFFCESVLPLILKQYPDIRLYIIGANPGKKIKKLADRFKNTIVVTGFVENIESVLLRMQVYICPLQAGTGIKNRVLQAMSVGIPIVSTSWGNKGINALNGHNIILAETPTELSEKICLLLENSALRRLIGNNGRQFVINNFNPIRIKELLISNITKHQQ